MQHHQQVEDVHRGHRSPAGWPGLPAATRRASTRERRSGPVRKSASWDPQAAGTADPTPSDIQVRVLDRMVGLLTLLVEQQEAGAFDADDLGLATLMTADLDRHLTTLMDARYEPADDVQVYAIEQALVNVRTRLHDCAAQR